MNSLTRAAARICQVAAIAACSAVSQPAAAQSSDALGECARIRDATVRLSCFDALARPPSAPPASADPASESAASRSPGVPPAPPSPRSPAAPEFPAPEAAGAQSAPPRPAAAPRPGVAETSGTAAARTVPAAPAAASPADAPAPTGTAAAPAADAADRRESERASRTVVVVSVRETISGLAVFTTDAGEVYEQTSARHARFSEPPFSAELEPATFGSFFLIPENETNRIRVSRRN